MRAEQLFDGALSARIKRTETRDWSAEKARARPSTPLPTGARAKVDGVNLSGTPCGPAAGPHAPAAGPHAPASDVCPLSARKRKGGGARGGGALAAGR